MDPDVARNFDDQGGVFESLGCRIEPCDLDLGGLEAAYDVLAWYRVTGDTAPVYENDRDRLAPSLRKRQEWFADLTGADMTAAEEYRLRLWRDVVAAFESHDVLVWPTDLTDPYRHDDETTSLSHDWRLLLVAPLLNLPAISVPCGFSAAGTPRGLQVIGRPGAGLAGVAGRLRIRTGHPVRGAQARLAVTGARARRNRIPGRHVPGAARPADVDIPPATRRRRGFFGHHGPWPSQGFRLPWTVIRPRAMRPADASVLPAGRSHLRLRSG